MGSRRASGQVVLPPLIAVVDDEEAVRKALDRLLQAAGLRTHISASCASFLERVLDRRPDCLILDLQMPGMSGIELLREMRACGISVPTIVITAHDEPKTHERCLQAGAIRLSVQAVRLRHAARRHRQSDRRITRVRAGLRAYAHVAGDP